MEKETQRKQYMQALFGNLGIAISKLIASILTGSTSMWAETYHSFSDTLNQILLLIGIRTSKKKVSERHHLDMVKRCFYGLLLYQCLSLGYLDSYL